MSSSLHALRGRLRVGLIDFPLTIEAGSGTSVWSGTWPRCAAAGVCRCLPRHGAMITRLLRGGIYLGGIDIQSQFVTQRDMVEACVGEAVVNREAEVVDLSGFDADVTDWSDFSLRFGVAVQ